MRGKEYAYVCHCGEGFSSEGGLDRHTGRHSREDKGALETAAESPT